MKWFRFYNEALDDPKVQQLPAPLFKHWVNLLCLASRKGGIVPCGDAVFGLRLRRGQEEAVIEALIARGLLERVADGLCPHNWQSRQFTSDHDGAARVKRYRKQHRNVTSGVTVTPPETDTENTENTETETEQQQQPIFALYEQTIGHLTPTIAQLLDEAMSEYSWTCISEHAFPEAARNNVRKWKYVEAILKSHAVNGCYESETGDDDDGREADLQQRIKDRAAALDAR